MIARHLAPVLALLALLPASALAQPAQPEPGSELEIAALEAELESARRALPLGDCVLACEALASMRRAAERLCALDPGPRCAAARARVEDATRQVRAQCPDCEAALEEHPAGVTPTPPPLKAAPPAEQVASAPPEAGAHGGCRGCALGGGDAGALVVGLGLALAAGLRRRTRRLD
ncbi:MAG: hypothetical protein HY908_13635 [Myxococcales bacterium]|nr:hypothetical protein [Myxococcales bacterium]